MHLLYLTHFFLGTNIRRTQYKLVNGSGMLQSEATRTQVTPLDPHFDGSRDESGRVTPPCARRSVPPVSVDHAP